MTIVNRFFDIIPDELRKYIYQLSLNSMIINKYYSIIVQKSSIQFMIMNMYNNQCNWSIMVFNKVNYIPRKRNLFGEYKIFDIYVPEVQDIINYSCKKLNDKFCDPTYWINYIKDCIYTIEVYHEYYLNITSNNPRIISQMNNLIKQMIVLITNVYYCLDKFAKYNNNLLNFQMYSILENILNYYNPNNELCLAYLNDM